MRVQRLSAAWQDMCWVWVIGILVGERSGLYGNFGLPATRVPLTEQFTARCYAAFPGMSKCQFCCMLCPGRLSCRGTWFVPLSPHDVAHMPAFEIVIVAALTATGNILLDVRTARVVHIDLGIAFEQGRLLNTAEVRCCNVVPFCACHSALNALNMQVDWVTHSCNVTADVALHKVPNAVV